MSSDSSYEQTLLQNKESSIANQVEGYDFRSRQHAIYRAFFANVGIAAVKFVCFLISKSSAMLSESIHSLVDSFNSLCLLVGVKRGAKPADGLHPFGYGLEANIWALFACILMLIGTFVAFLSGVDKITNPSIEEIQILLNKYPIIFITLIISGCFELWAMTSAAKAVLDEMQINVKNPIKAYLMSIAYIAKIKSPTTKFVWFEDSAAFFGIVIALGALSVSKFLVPIEYANIPDGVASLLIGTILFFLAITLLKNNVNFLTGAAAEPQIEQLIKDVAENLHEIAAIHELKTMDMGSSGVIVNMSIEVDPETPVKEADDIADLLERHIRERVKKISHVNIEILANDAEDNWGEKFEKLIEEGKAINAIDGHEGNILANFSNFANTVVKEIMVPRIDVHIINVEDTLINLADMIIETGHTRIPVYENQVDNIIGVVNAKDVLKAIRNKETEMLSIKDMVRETILIPENKFISDLLTDLTNAKTQIAIVIDEHGGLAGIVTVEDIIEELVGEIYDEFDDVELPLIEQIDDFNLSANSKIDIEDLNERYDLDIPCEDFQTIGGYVFGLLGREPEVGDQIEDKNITYTVLEVDGCRVAKVNMKKNTPFIDTSISNSLKEDKESQINE